MQKTSTAPVKSARRNQEADFGDVLSEVDFDPGISAPPQEAPSTLSAPPQPTLPPMPPKVEEKQWKSLPADFDENMRNEILDLEDEEIHALSSTIISELLASIDKIPPFPIVANRLIETLEGANVRTDVVERLVAQDAVIAAKILSAANSPYYNLPTTIETLPHAIRVIGLQEVSRVAVAVAAAAVFDVEERLAHESVSQQQQVVWSHSVASARGAAWIAMQRGEDIQRAYVAGLLHDVGKPVALRGLGLALVNGRLREAPRPSLIFAAIEQAHTDVGEILADAWQLTDYLSAVVAEHHRDNKDDLLSRVVELASLVDEMRTNPAVRAAAPIRIQALAKQLGISQMQLGDLQLEMKRASTTSLRF